MRTFVLNISLLSTTRITWFIQSIRKQPREVFCPKVFLEISQNSHENTCARISFLIKRVPATLLKNRLRHMCFLWILQIFYEHLIYRTLLGDCFCPFYSLFFWWFSSTPTYYIAKKTVSYQKDKMQPQILSKFCHRCNSTSLGTLWFLVMLNINSKTIKKIPWGNIHDRVLSQ